MQETLSKGDQFINAWKTPLLDGLRAGLSAVTGGGNVSAAVAIQLVLFDVFYNRLGMLSRPDGSTPTAMEDVKLSVLSDCGELITDERLYFTAEAVQWEMAIGASQVINLLDEGGFSFGEGLPFEFSISGGLDLEIGWSFKLGLGFSKQGFYLVLDPLGNELSIFAELRTDDSFKAKGVILVMAADMEAVPGDPSGIRAEFGINLFDGESEQNSETATSYGRLTIGELLTLLVGVIQPNFAFNLHFAVKTTLGLEGVDGSPRLLVDNLNMDETKIIPLIAGSSDPFEPVIRLTGLKLDVGSAVSGILKPIFELLNDKLMASDGMKKFLETIDKDIKALSDLLKKKVTAVTLAEMLIDTLVAIGGGAISGYSVGGANIVSALTRIPRLVQAFLDLDTSGETIVVPFGDWKIEQGTAVLEAPPDFTVISAQRHHMKHEVQEVERNAAEVFTKTVFFVEEVSAKVTEEIESLFRSLGLPGEIKTSGDPCPICKGGRIRNIWYGNENSVDPEKLTPIPKTGSGIDALTREMSIDAGMQLKIFDIPTVIGLLAGEDVSLFEYILPRYKGRIECRFGSALPIGINIGVKVSGDFEINFAIGLTSKGLFKMVEQIKTLAEDDGGDFGSVAVGVGGALLSAVDGLYIRDKDCATCEDIPEIKFNGFIGLFFELSALVFRIRLEAGFDVLIIWDLYDPNEDGRLSLGELRGIIQMAPNPAEGFFNAFDLTIEFCPKVNIVIEAWLIVWFTLWKLEWKPFCFWKKEYLVPRIILGIQDGDCGGVGALQMRIVENWIQLSNDPTDTWHVRQTSGSGNVGTIELGFGPRDAPWEDLIVQEFEGVTELCGTTNCDRVGYCDDGKSPINVVMYDVKVKTTIIGSDTNELLVDSKKLVQAHSSSHQAHSHAMESGCVTATLATWIFILVMTTISLLSVILQVRQRIPLTHATEMMT
eukprot:TRINITY_DN10602_c6_g5_i3.p1 TRINITY_DN10602_c6_g5~~TRINITY_DN10602_c6_g5_i3.p1  ORF type:complete len:941 (+),score=187.30 TRINITY_DN10602_c6_g5_i3:2032-4854(+)